MITIFLRLILIYFVTVGSIRLMGKRQVGELQMSELVTAFFLSELASYPIANQNIPLTYGIIPVVALICIEVILSFLSTRVPLMKRLLDCPPSMLIRKGKLDHKELDRARMTVDELLSQLRLKDVSALSEVNYALLEPNGQLSVIRKAAACPPTRRETNTGVKDGGMQHLILSDGTENPRGMQGAGLSEKDLERILRTRKLSRREVFVLCVDDAGEITCIRKEDT